MTDLLHLPAQPGAPIACDMRGATDTPEERLAEYGELFERALLRRERLRRAVVFTFAPTARAQVEDLARREAACCPFLEYRVEATGVEVIFTITNPDRAEAEATLDEFYALSSTSSSTSRSTRRAIASRIRRTPSRSASAGSSSSQSS